MLVIKAGPEGPDLVTCLVVPKMFKKLLQYVRESKLAILEEFKPPKTNNYNENKEKQTKTLKN